MCKDTFKYREGLLYVAKEKKILDKELLLCPMDHVNTGPEIDKIFGNREVLTLVI